MAFKISAAYWEKMTQMEKDFIMYRAPIDGVAMVKMMINDARKQHPDFKRIYGKGYIELPNGEVRLWSGDTTRKFNLVSNG
jgi:hypothetical protein